MGFGGGRFVAGADPVLAARANRRRGSAGLRGPGRRRSQNPSAEGVPPPGSSEPRGQRGRLGKGRGRPVGLGVARLQPPGCGRRGRGRGRLRAAPLAGPGTRAEPRPGEGAARPSGSGGGGSRAGLMSKSMRFLGASLGSSPSSSKAIASRGWTPSTFAKWAHGGCGIECQALSTRGPRARGRDADLHLNEGTGLAGGRAWTGAPPAPRAPSRPAPRTWVSACSRGGSAASRPLHRDQACALSARAAPH